MQRESTKKQQKNDTMEMAGHVPLDISTNSRFLGVSKMKSVWQVCGKRKRKLVGLIVSTSYKRTERRQDTPILILTDLIKTRFPNPS